MYAICVRLFVSCSYVDHDANQEAKISVCPYQYLNDLFTKMRRLRDTHINYSDSGDGTQESYGKTKWKEGDTVGIAVDLGNNSTKIEYYLNGESQGVVFE